MKITQFGSVKMLLTLAGIAPSLLLLTPAPPATAVPVRNLNLVTDSRLPQALKSPSPFIDAAARHNSLEKMQVHPGGIFQNDGGTGKEASDPKHKESKDGKESCEGGNCGELFFPGNTRINPNPILTLPGVAQPQLRSQLIQSQQPIM